MWAAGETKNLEKAVECARLLLAMYEQDTSTNKVVDVTTQAHEVEQVTKLTEQVVAPSNTWRNDAGNANNRQTAATMVTSNMNVHFTAKTCQSPVLLLWTARICSTMSMEMTKEYLRSVCQGRQIPLFSVSPKSPHPTTFNKVTVATVKSKLVVISGKLGTFGERYIWWALYMYLVNWPKK